MNTSLLCSPASNEGHGSPKGNGGNPAAAQPGNAQKPGAAAPADGPRFDQGLHYGDPNLRYPGDPVIGAPISDGARVKMGLDRRNNSDLRNFLANHITQMDNNPNFTQPAPSAVDFLALFTSYDTAFNNWMSLKTALDDASTALAQARVLMVEGAKVRGAYVQQASNGNTNVIISSGLEVANPRTPVGQLPAPINLKVELNGDEAVMKIKWKPVEKARGYLLECSPDVQPRQFTQLTNTTKSGFEKQMVAGETYVFRVAASGGSTGQSYWSPEVIRGAA